MGFWRDTAGRENRALGIPVLSTKRIRRTEDDPHTGESLGIEADDEGTPPDGPGENAEGSRE